MGIWQAIKRSFTPRNFVGGAAAGIAAGGILGAAAGRPTAGVGIGVALSASQESDQRPAAPPDDGTWTDWPGDEK